MMRRALIAVACAALVPAAARPQAATPEVAVVVHPATPVESLSLGELRRMLLGERQFWPDQTRVTILLPPAGSPERTAVLRTVYRMNESEYRQYWVAKIFRAEVTGGPRVATTGQALRLAAAARGTIALIPAGAVDGAVKLLLINGRRPGQSGYPLQ
jgi:hypothetical protein